MIHRYAQSKRRHAALFSLLGGGVLVLIAAVWVQAAPQANKNQDAEQKFERILVLPSINMSEIHGENADLRGPLSEEVFVTGVVSPESSEFIDVTLRSRLTQLENIHLLEPSADMIASRVGLSPEQGPISQRFSHIQKAGRQRGADVVLCTFLYVFRERVGTAYGVDTPARISFELILVSVDTGRPVWQGSYTETQTTLNENLLRIDKFIQRKGRWISAEEMAAQAIDDMVKKMQP